eukprot:GHUV01041971.1.p1 GENE.GHUV01041971.1~~GHUV01041971.1.p1  ORF type:complete len:296 (+),score=78.49 GHUV01041971.1:273-1160(+)
MQDKSKRTQSQIIFDEPGAGQYKSSYLSTLGAEARHKRPQSTGPSISSNSSNAQDGYVHGSLSTAGITGASPAYQSLTKHAAKQIERLVADGSSPDAAAQQTAAAAVTVGPAGPAAAADEADPGMRPRVRIPAHMNRPDLAHNIKDIEGAQPNPRDIIKRPRGTNPLNPEYKLAAGWVLQDVIQQWLIFSPQAPVSAAALGHRHQASDVTRGKGLGCNRCPGCAPLQQSAPCTLMPSACTAGHRLDRTQQCRHRLSSAQYRLHHIHQQCIRSNGKLGLTKQHPSLCQSRRLSVAC